MGALSVLSIPIEESGDVDRDREPVTLGVPFPRGTLVEDRCLRLSDEQGRPLALQTEVLDRWSDGSCRWVLLDFQATVAARRRISYGLTWNSEAAQVATTYPVQVDQSAGIISVDTGIASYWLDREIFQPFRRVLVNGNEIIGEGSSAIALQDSEDRTWHPKIGKVLLETNGPIRSTLLFEGTFGCTQKAESFASFFSRVHFFSGHSRVVIEFSIRNPRAAKHTGGLWDLGDPGSVYFKELSLHAELRSAQAATIRWAEGPQGDLRSLLGETLEIYQDSSGGENWKSRNHVNRFGAVANKFRGYRIRAGEINSTGDRAQPIVVLSNSEGCIAATVENFWQNFPKALEANGRTLTVRLFPKQYADVFELQGGEQKTHRIHMDFQAPSSPRHRLTATHCPLIPRLEPTWYAASKVFPYMVPEAVDPNRDYLDLVHSVIDGKQSLFQRREIIDEYGWRNFGDLYADHESAYYAGPAPVISHYNNQYDGIYSFGLHYARSGDPRWFELMRDLARHVIDIDIYHTLADKPAYSGGLFWHTDHYADAATCTHRTYSKQTLDSRGLKEYGGGPSNEHLYTTGLLSYYYLTGDSQAKETVVDLANWVIRMDDGRLTPLRFLSRGATGLASQTASRDYHGPGRGAANCVSALLDAFRLNRDRRFLEKAEELIRRCIHPRDSIEKLDLHDAERRWSYLVFLQALGKYLDCKTEWGESDEMFDYARESLLHFSRWMLEHEVPYSRVLDRVEYPTETWVVHDLRKSNVLEWAASYANKEERERLLQKAAFFYDNCFNDLANYPTKVFTRPLILLLQYGYMHGHFKCSGRLSCDDRQWRRGNFPLAPGFKPQRLLAVSRLKLIGSIGSVVMISLLFLFTVFGLAGVAR